MPSFFTSRKSSSAAKALRYGDYESFQALKFQLRSKAERPCCEPAETHCRSTVPVIFVTSPKGDRKRFHFSDYHYRPIRDPKTHDDRSGRTLHPTECTVVEAFYAKRKEDRRLARLQKASPPSLTMRTRQAILQSASVVSNRVHKALVSFPFANRL